MNGYLGFDQIQELVTAAVAGGLLGPVNRMLLMNGIDPMWVAFIPNGPDQFTQLKLDLMKLNETDRLANGTVPFVVWLRNAETFPMPAGPAQVIQKYKAAVSSAAEGVRAASLPEPKTLGEVIRNEAIIFQNDMVTYSFLQEGWKAGEAVARLSVPRFENGTQVMADQGKPWLMLGTGFLISKNMVLTNHHVINARVGKEGDAAPADFEKQGLETTIEFGYDGDHAVVTVATVSKVEIADTSLDYCILRIQPAQPFTPLRFHGERVQVKASTYLPVNIIQHPQGQSKRVAIRNNLVTGADGMQLRYFTDTDNGSSGSPVFNDQWNVVALHRGSKHTNEVMFQGKPTAVVNFGTHIQSIVEHVAANRPDLANDLSP